MIRVIVMFPKTSDSHFDMDYYLNKHVPMVVEKYQSLGITIGGSVDQGLSSLVPGEPAAYAAIGTLIFETMEDFQAGYTTHGAEIMADIPNYTNVQPVVQINQAML